MKIKRPNVSNFVKNINYGVKGNGIEKKITDHSHDKYITTPDLKKLTPENFAARLVQEWMLLSCHVGI